MSKILSDRIPELDINKHLTASAGMPVATKIVQIDTPDEWGLAEFIVREFEKYYKRQMRNVWKPYIRNRREGSDDHALALEGDLRQSGVRQSLTFPIFHDALYDRDDSLHQKLEQHCPDIFKDPRKLLKFQKKYPEFVVAKSV